MAAEYMIRQLTSEDEPILWEALYQGLHRAGGDASPSREVLRRPEFARYVEGWGREGDRGFIASDTESHQLLGAVWYREPAMGMTPELLFVVAPGQRKRGIGAALLTQWVRTNPEQSEISMRVDVSNPAVRLYERFGFRVVEDREGFVTLRRDA
ncbi:MAG TPA: GNAT family N-acetyltransferase [Chthoniobacterales bacterium]|nr:GNAT family N-acetyltransferase [Chthoniobacterales bacterium]